MQQGVTDVTDVTGHTSLHTLDASKRADVMRYLLEQLQAYQVQVSYLHYTARNV